jgi:hypothetical protein
MFPIDLIGSVKILMVNWPYLDIYIDGLCDISFKLVFWYKKKKNDLKLYRSCSSLDFPRHVHINKDNKLPYSVPWRLNQKIHKGFEKCRPSVMMMHILYV